MMYLHTTIHKGNIRQTCTYAKRESDEVGSKLKIEIYEK